MQCNVIVFCFWFSKPYNKHVVVVLLAAVLLLCRCSHWQKITNKIWIFCACKWHFCTFANQKCAFCWCIRLSLWGEILSEAAHLRSLLEFDVNHGRRRWCFYYHNGSSLNSKLYIQLRSLEVDAGWILISALLSVKLLVYLDIEVRYGPGKCFILLFLVAQKYLGQKRVSGATS